MTVFIVERGECGPMRRFVVMKRYWKEYRIDEFWDHWVKQ